MRLSLSFKKILAVSLLLLCACFGQAASAASTVAPYFMWYFTNSGMTYGPTDTIAMEAVFVNLDTTDIVIPSTGVGASLTYGTFPSGAYPGAGDYEFNFTAFDCFAPPPGCLANATVKPGESKSFLFGTFTPVTSVAPGTYTTMDAQISINTDSSYAWTSEEYGGHFVATVVPLPGTAWLFISGIAGLFSMTRARKNTLRMR